MTQAVWKIPRDWRPSLADRTALYPALHLRAAGHGALISSDPPFGAWAAADLRVVVSDGPLGEDDRDLMRRSAARGLPLVLASQSGLTDEDRAIASEVGAVIVAWRDPGPLASAPPRRPGQRMLEAAASPARLAEDGLISAELGLGTSPTIAAEGRRIVVAAADSRSLDAIWPALEGRPAQTYVTSEDAGELARTAERPGVIAVPAHDPGLMALIHGASG